MRRTYKSFFTHLHSATTHRYLHKKISTLCRGSCSVFTFTAKTSIRQTKCTAPSTNHCHRDGGTEGAGGKQGAARPPQILVDQLITLSQPGGIDYAHQILTPQIFRPSATCCHALSSERTVACARAHRSTF